jgi:hypothetical protein
VGILRGYAEHPTFSWFFTEGVIKKRVGLCFKFLQMKKNLSDFQTSVLKKEQLKSLFGGCHVTNTYTTHHHHTNSFKKGSTDGGMDQMHDQCKG